MPKLVLITDPSHDNITSYLGSWVSSIISAHTNPAISINHIQREDVNKANLEIILSRDNPDLILFHGHGNSDEMLGYNDESILKCGINTDTISNKIVNCLSCNSGKLLGPELIAKGARAFTGYTEPFTMFSLKKTAPQDQLNDVAAQLCLNPAFEIHKTLLNGGSVQDAYDKSQKEARGILQQIIVSNTGEQKLLDIASCIFRNLNHQILIGDGSARLI